MVFPHSSVGKESSWDAGDPSSIPRSGRSTGEGIGYPLQCSWASLVTADKEEFWSILVHWFLKCQCSLCHLLFGHFKFILIHGPNIPGSYTILFFTVSDLVISFGSIFSHSVDCLLVFWMFPFLCKCFSV